jgi:hypothetical protein
MSRIKSALGPGCVHGLGQKRKCPGSRGTSVLPSGADIVSLPRHVRLVPQAVMTEAEENKRCVLRSKRPISSRIRAGSVAESSTNIHFTRSQEI